MHAFAQRFYPSRLSHSRTGSARTRPLAGRFRDDSLGLLQQALTGTAAPTRVRPTGPGVAAASVSSPPGNGHGTVQRKPEVSGSGDWYEQAAEATADRVMSASEVQPRGACACGGGCPRCRAAGSGPQQIQRLASGSRGASAVPASAEGVLRSTGQPLSPEVRGFMEPRLGHDFSGVRVHADGQAAASARSLGARAYTVGADIAFGRGEYAPETTEGRRLLAHELTHVVQQSPGGGGSVSPQVQRARLPCYSKYTIPIYGVNLPGASGSISTDLTFANSVLCQCGIELVLQGGESWQTNLMDQQDPKGVLNEYDSVTNPTQEERALMAYRPGGSAVHVYYVPQLSAGSRGETIGSADCSTCVDTVVVANSSEPDTFAHEFVHVLLPDDGHHSNPDNLFASGKIRNVGVGDLEQGQCDRMKLP